ncbi:AraC family transcriptional regulator [Novosphingobium sp.]|uniref:AraC family transcriptional regulator n=1 Tax=Novosphingobium sp. TaxID=1874826 RepID=UPI0025CC85D5|nr:AraC family transcriptional regulator [Novosphingobium sp.]
MTFSSGQDDQAAKGQLTSSSLIRLDHFPVPAALAPFVVTLYHFTCDEILLSDVVPAGVGYVMALLSGSAKVTFAHGESVDAPPLALLTPTSGAAHVTADGPFHLVGAALSPLGWGALTGMPAFEARNQVLAAASWLGDEAGPALRRWRTGYVSAALTGEAICAELAAILTAQMKMPSPRHISLIRETGDWLSSSFDPELSALGRSTGYSVRQVERLVKRYFGATPRELVRKYRALRVAALLQSPDCDDERAAALTNLFYDQSHLIREMRHYLGRTPTRLVAEESALTQAMNGIDNFRHRRPSFARIPKG